MPVISTLKGSGVRVRPNGRSWALVLGAFLTLLATGACGTAHQEGESNAQGPARHSSPSGHDSTPEGYLTHTYGITMEEARVRLERQSSAQALSDQLVQRFPEVFGGIWIDNSGGGRVKIALAGDEATIREAEAYVRRSSISRWTDVVPASASLKELGAVADRLRAERDSLEDYGLPRGFAFGVDPTAQRVFIYQPGLTDEQKADIAERFGPLVEVLEEELRARPL